MKLLPNRVAPLVYRGLLVLIFILGGFHGQIAQASGAPLGVTQIEALQTSAISDGTFADGWKWIFNVTVPSDQTLLQMKFGDWTNGSNTIPAIGNMRFYSAQATDANGENSALTINASNAYSSTTIMHLDSTQDLDSLIAGRQIQITMETAIPAGSANGSYSNSYGINTQVDPTAQGTLALAAGSDNPQTATVQGNSQNATSGITLTTFTLQANNAAVTLSSLPVTIATTSSAGSSIIRSLKLYQGSTLLDTESISAGGSATTTFTNLGLLIPAGTTDSFKIVADINRIDGTNFVEGSSVAVSVTGYGLDATTTGSVTGSPITFRSNSLSVASAPTSAVATAALTSSNAGSQQTGTFTFVFNVTAFGQTIYVASTSNAYTLTINDQTTGTATSSTNITSGITSTANRSGLGNFQVNSGQTAAFTVTATLSHGGSNHYFYAVLNSLVYGTADNAATTATTTLPSNYTTNAVAISS